MPLLILIILFLILFPSFLPFFLLYLIIGLIFFLPFLFLFESLFSLIFIPWQIIEIASDKRVRQNHALEHATVNVIEESFGPQKISGLAAKNGFTLMGDLPPSDIILNAAYIALERLKRGEKNLAIHPRCGTSIAAANFIFSVSFIVLLLYTGYLSIFSVILAFIISHIFGKPFGKILQKYFTTSADVKDVEITGIGYKGHDMGFFLGFLPIPSNSIFIYTRVKRPIFWIFRRW